MNELVKAPAMPTQMVAAVCEADPDDNTARLVSRLRTSGCSVVVKHRLTFPTDPKTGEASGWRETVSGCSITMGTSANHRACLAIVDEAMAPAAAPNIGMWLTEVSHITARRSESEDESVLTMAAYIKRLLPYPGDIVRQTLQEWSGKWFPTWSELKEILEARMASRAAIRTALCNLMPKADEEPAPGGKPKRTLEELKQARWELNTGGVPIHIHRADSATRRDYIERETAKLNEEIALLDPTDEGLHV